MKKQTNIFCAVLLIAITCCTVNAQTIAFNPKASSANKSNTATAVNVNEKVADNVLKKFSKQFPGVTGESWAKLDKGYEVFFKNGNVQNRVFLTGKGMLNYQISYYSEAELPADIRKRVKSEYFDYSIFGVQEINYNKIKVYLVIMEDKDSWKILRLDDNNMDIYKEYVKG